MRSIVHFTIKSNLHKPIVERVSSLFSKGRFSLHPPHHQSSCEWKSCRSFRLGLEVEGVHTPMACRDRAGGRRAWGAGGKGRSSAVQDCNFLVQSLGG